MKTYRLLFILLVFIFLTGFGSGIQAAPESKQIDTAQKTYFQVFPDDGMDNLLKMLGGAKERVYVKNYLLLLEEVIDTLSQVKERGVDVKVMVEEHPFRSDETGEKTLARLLERGIPAKSGSPDFALTHEKSIVIDGCALILTGNLTYSAFHHNREFGYIDRDPSDVREIVDCFNADWNRTAFAPERPSLVWSPVNSREKINSVIKSAKQELIVYAEEVNDDEQIDLLIQSEKKGVQIRLLTPKPENMDNVTRLTGAGVMVRFPEKLYIHAKAMVADGTLGFTGSENISTSSLDRNRELGVLLKNPAVLSIIMDTFNRDWNSAPAQQSFFQSCKAYDLINAVKLFVLSPFGSSPQDQ